MQAWKGGEEVGGSFRRDLKSIGEVQAPSRGVRKFFYVALFLATGILKLLLSTDSYSQSKGDKEHLA